MRAQTPWLSVKTHNLSAKGIIRVNSTSEKQGGCGQRVFGRCFSGGSGCFSGGSDGGMLVVVVVMSVHQISLFLVIYFILRRVGKNKAEAHHTSTLPCRVSM